MPMHVVRLIKDPIYLARQHVANVPAHQVPGLLVHLKAMVVLCRKNQLGAMTAPQAGLPYNFFVAENPDPRDPDYDVVFDPIVTPVESDGQKLVEQQGVNGVTYKVPRWRTVDMTWNYHNGYAFEEKHGRFQGDVAYIAQQQFDRLRGVYIGPDSEYEVVTIQTEVSDG